MAKPKFKNHQRIIVEREKKLELERCIACNGSGYYDHNGSPPCESCDGTGKQEVYR